MYSVPAADWLDLYAVGIAQLAHTVGESILCREGGDAARLKGLWGGLVLIISAKWTEWNLADIGYCFHFCVSVCLYVCAHSVLLVWMGGMTYCSSRNVFDSCVKSWHYFCTDKISLETSFYWLSNDIVRFKIEVGVTEKCTKMQQLYHAKWIYRSTPCSDNVMLSASKGIIDSSLLCCKFTWQIYARSERLIVLVTTADRENDKPTNRW